MYISIQLAGTTATIKLQGKFTFDAHKEFRQAMKAQMAGPCRAIDIDFSAVDYLDSAALGMLLLAREQSAEVGKVLALRNCTGHVKGVLDVANFQRLFTID